MPLLAEIIEKLNARVPENQWDMSVVIDEVLPLNSSAHKRNSISWSNDSSFDMISADWDTTFILSENCYKLHRKEVDTSAYRAIIVDDPRAAFGKLIEEFFVEQEMPTGISDSACIHSGVQIPTSTYIGENVVIEKNVRIGEGCHIDHNSVIKANTVIGNQVKIGCNCTIGNIGFGYQPDESNKYKVISHIGNVVIENLVEIGNNVAIDRAVLGATLIGENVKIDNLVHIAHGVTIGKNSLIIANSMIAGSVQIGENCWVAPSSSIIQKKKIGNGAIVGIGSVVLKDVSEGDIVAGVPAKRLKRK